jgi:phage anti-repressor protein
MNDLKQLVPIKEEKVGGTFQKCVSARQLHDYLKVKSRFATWINNRINKFEFAINEDYFTFSKNLENGGKLIEYVITLDMAKQLTMVENNAKGSQARRYFIQCEKALRQAVHLKEYYTITEYAEHKNVILTDFEKSIIWARGAVASKEKGISYEFVKDDVILHYSILQPVLGNYLEERKEREQRKQVNVVGKNQNMFLVIEKQQLQSFIISKGLTQEYYRYCER